MIDGKMLCHQPTKNELKTFDSIRKVTTGQGDDNATGCFLNYPYFEKYCKLIKIYLSKHQKIDADPKAMQQINFTGSLTKAEGVAMFFIIDEVKETFRFSKTNSYLIMILFRFNIILIQNDSI